MKFLDFLILLIAIVIVASILISYIKHQRSKDILELQERKDELLGVSIPDQLFTLKSMELSGKTKRSYENLSASWNTVTNFQFSEIEETLIRAEQAIEEFKFARARNEADAVRDLLDNTEEEVKRIEQEVNELLSLEHTNAEKSAQVLERVNQARKSIMNHSFDYGPAIETLEKNLQYIELNFTKYNEVTTNGDYLEARDILTGLESDVASLEEILEKIPEMYQTIKDDYEDALEDLRSGYQRMLESNYQFERQDTLEEIDRIQEMLQEAKNHIKNADLVDAKTLMDKADRDIDDLYDYLEREIQAQEYVRNNVDKVEDVIIELSERNRYVTNEVDRIAQSYVLHGNQLEKIQALREELRVELANFQKIQEELSKDEAVYSRLADELRKIIKNTEEIAKEQENILLSLSNLNQEERDAKQQLDEYELDLRNLKRRLEKRNLPGLTQDYYEVFYQVTDAIEYLSQSLNRVQIDMDEINQLSDSIGKHLESLEEKTDEIIDSAMLTELMIQRANRYRYDVEDVDDAIRQAQSLFYNEYRYVDASAVIERALRRVDPDAPTQVRRMYYRDKENRI